MNDKQQQVAEAIAASEVRDWSTATEVQPDRPAIVHSVRFSGQNRGLADWIAAEADRLGVTPSDVIRYAVADAAKAAVDDEPVLVRRSDLVHMIQNVVDGLPAA